MQRGWILVVATFVCGSMSLPSFAQGLPTPWETADVGAVGQTGQTTYSDGTFTVRGAGADIWGTVDSFRFVYQPVPTDGYVEARVVSEEANHPFAKAGVMFRSTLDAASPEVILDMKPDGELEFMARFAPGENTVYMGGAQRVADSPWLKIVRTGSVFTSYQSADGVNWATVLSVDLSDASDMIAGLAVTSHDVGVLNTSVFDSVIVWSLVSPNLVRDPGFESETPPALEYGWASDRESPAKSELNQPRAGMMNGACWTPENLDCGLYQDLLAPTTGRYLLTLYATADRAGGLVGANVNGALAASMEVEPRGFGNYGNAYVMSFAASVGDTIRVWMYSPAVPGYVVVDDVSLTVDQTRTVTTGTWTIGPGFPGPPIGRFAFGGSDFQVNGSYDSGIVQAATACSAGCQPGQTVSLTSGFENEAPLTIESLARGTATVDGTSYSFVEFGGAVTLQGSTVTLPAATGPDFPQIVSVSAPFTLSGDLKGFEVLGLRDPKLVFDLVLAGRGTATLDLLASPSGTLTFQRLTYQFDALSVDTTRK